MPNKRYLAGRRYEWRIRDAFRERGFEVTRAAGSKGIFDLICIKPSQTASQNGEIVLIQTKWGKSAERELEKLKSLKDRYAGLYRVRVELL